MYNHSGRSRILLTRLWFVVCVTWAILASRCCYADIKVDSAGGFFILFPFIVGIALKYIARYVVTGRISQGRFDNR